MLRFITKKKGKQKNLEEGKIIIIEKEFSFNCDSTIGNQVVNC